MGIHDVVPAELVELVENPPPRCLTPEAKARFFSLLGFSMKPRWKIVLTLVLAFILFCFAMFFPWGYPIELLLRWGPLETTNGRVVRYKPSMFNAGRDSKKTVIPITHVYFQFMTQSGEEVTTRNYFTGLRNEWVFGKEGVATATMPVRVTYSRVFNRWALIPGGRMSPHGPEWLLSAIVPIVLFVFFRLWRKARKKAAMLMDDGLAVDADMIGVTKVRRQRAQRVYAVRIGFNTGSGRAEAGQEVYAADEGRELMRMRDSGTRVRILYQPSQPGNILVLGRVPES